MGAGPSPLWVGPPLGCWSWLLWERRLRKPWRARQYADPLYGLCITFCLQICALLGFLQRRAVMCKWNEPSPPRVSSVMEFITAMKAVTATVTTFSPHSLVFTQFYTQIHTQKVLTFYMRNNGFQRAGLPAFSKQHDITLHNWLSDKDISTNVTGK